MKDELHRCVIDFNVRTIELRSSKTVWVDGPRWILDGSGVRPDRVAIPAGTQFIESFTVDRAGHRTVKDTTIAGVGTIQGKLPTPGPDGTIELTF